MEQTGSQGPRNASNVAPALTQQQQPIIFHHTSLVDDKAAAREQLEKDSFMRWVVVGLLVLVVLLGVGVIVSVVVLLLVPTTTTTTSSASDLDAPTSFPTDEGNDTSCPMLDSLERLTPNGMTVSLDTRGAFFDPLEYNITGCGQIEDLQSNGVWYALMGTGMALTISTCTQVFPSFDSQLVVYTLGNQTMGGCTEELECVASNDNFCGLQSSVTFVSKSDQTYFVYVSGTNLAIPRLATSSSDGEFSLTASTSPEGSCQGAESIVPSANGHLPVIHVGELLPGTFSIDPCNPTAQQTTHEGEQWYTVTGTGKYLVASTCHYLSNFEARLSVFSGTQCDVLTCVSGDGDDCGNGNEINWFAEEGTNYFLVVYTPTLVPDVQFGLSIQEVW
jgi:hypothetical protein